MFKRKAAAIQAGINDKSVKVVVNSAPPRKGTFSVAVNGDDIVSFVGMARPFKPLREADIDALVNQINSAIDG